MRQGELHLQLEILAKEFRENPSDETGDRILAAMAKIIRDNEKILIDGIPSPVNPTITVPSGYYAKDGKFYFHIFSFCQFIYSNAFFTQYTFLSSIPTTSKRHGMSTL